MDLESITYTKTSILRKENLRELENNLYRYNYFGRKIADRKRRSSCTINLYMSFGVNIKVNLD